MKFYTYASVLGNNILYRGYDGDCQLIERIPFKPTLYVQSKNKNAEWRSLYDGQPLDPMKFDSLKEARDFREKYKDVSGFKVHGIDRFEYQFINEQFPDDIEYDLGKVRTLVMDIEVVDEDKDGFPDIGKADQPIVLISMYNSRTDTVKVYGLKDYDKTPDDNFEYFKFKDEKHLLVGFIQECKSELYDVWTGWNTSQFDIPYIVNRIMRVLGEEMVKALSPFKYIREKVIEIRGKQVQTYDIYGVVSLDYLELYKKFTYSQKESYRLDFIAKEELKKSKVDLPGKTFRDSYINHFQTFVQYNAIDTLLVKELDDKMKLIELAFNLAYIYKCNLQDVFKTVSPWEILIFNHLAKKKIAVPPRRQTFSHEFEGAWVKTPIVGLHGWTMSFDFAGLYPAIIVQWNISPETVVHDYTQINVNDILNDTELGLACMKVALESDYTIAANGSMYSKEFRGFLPELMKYMTDSRKITKKKMLEAEKEYERTKDKSLVAKISALNNRQMAFKISNNSAYGALGNKGFLYYNYVLAEATTLTGQLSNIDLCNSLNKMMNDILKTSGVDYILQGDTDSNYLNCQPLVDKFCVGKSVDEIVKFLDKFGDTVVQKVIHESIKRIYDKTNAYDMVMSNKREAIASKALIRAKKNYALYMHNSEGVDYNPPKLKTMGIEIVRSSTPEWCRTKLKECVKYIFEKDEKFLRAYFANLFEEYQTLPPEQIAFPRGVNDLDKWESPDTIYKKGTPINARGSLLYNRFFVDLGYAPIQSGDKIKFVYLSMPNPIKEDVIAFPSKLPPELNLYKYINWELQFNKSFREPLESLINCAGWHLDDIATLDDFFE